MKILPLVFKVLISWEQVWAMLNDMMLFNGQFLSFFFAVTNLNKFREYFSKYFHINIFFVK